jgi:hypothetical protein
MQSNNPQSRRAASHQEIPEIGLTKLCKVTGTIHDSPTSSISPRHVGTPVSNANTTLSNKITCIQRAAEREIRKLTMYNIPWSLESQKLRDKIERLEILVWRKKKVKVSVKRICQFLKKWSSSHAFTCSLKGAISIRNAAYQEYKKTKEQALHKGKIPGIPGRRNRCQKGHRCCH